MKCPTVGEVASGTPSEPATPREHDETLPPTQVVSSAASKTDLAIVQAKSPQAGDDSSKPASPEIAGEMKEADDLKEKLTRKASEFKSFINKQSI